MLLTKSINKIFRTTLIMFLILTVFTLTNQSKEKVLRTSLEINEIKELPKSEIYLLSNDNYLVKANIYLETISLEEKSKKIIEYLKESNNKIPIGLNGYLPNNVKINSLIIENNNLKLNFSKELLNTKNIDIIVTGIVYSLVNLNEVETVEILVDNNYLENYNYKLNKDIGINKNYFLNSRKDINKITVFYYDEINDIEYLTPVTKYINDEREKVEIIINELSDNIPNNLISYLSDKTNLIDYQEENDLMILNFDKQFKVNNKEINQKTMNLIAQSIFENYDINMVLFQENSEKIDYIRRK